MADVVPVGVDVAPEDVVLTESIVFLFAVGLHKNTEFLPHYIWCERKSVERISKPGQAPVTVA